MGLRKLGERKIIKLLTSRLRRSLGMISDFDDDAASFRFSGKMVATTDMGSMGTHFTNADPAKIGRKIITSNATDLLSKGAIPKYALVSMGFPESTKMEWLEKMYAAMDTQLSQYDAFLIGGDTNKASEFAYSVAMLGEAKGSILKRSSAEEGDCLVLTGNIGSAAAGYLIRKKGFKATAAEKREFFQAQDDPKINAALCKKIWPQAHAGIDVSDGLAFELNEIARLSGKKIVVEWEKIPRSPMLEKFCKRNGLNEEKIALNYGEDYQIVFTTPNAEHGIIIGRVEKGKGVFLKRKGKLKKIQSKGYEHFKSN
ncbi:TPA: thiamine-phosphate kinase [Candidatus Micrarchaeota archaeon]|nr:thiamine-phosphate kinase [Candidatus Micrarchaeota archaeon]